MIKIIQLFINYAIIILSKLGLKGILFPLTIVQQTAKQQTKMKTISNFFFVKIHVFIKIRKKKWEKKSNFFNLLYMINLEIFQKKREKIKKG